MTDVQEQTRDRKKVSKRMVYRAIDKLMQPDWKSAGLAIEVEILLECYERDTDTLESQQARIEELHSEMLHWKGMTKGRESEIDKHLARIEKLEAEKKMAVFFLQAIVGGKFTPEYRVFEEADKALAALQTDKEPDEEGQEHE